MRASGRARVAASLLLAAAGPGPPAVAQVPDELRPEAPAEALPPGPARPPAPATAPRGAPRLAPHEPIPPAELEAFVDATVRLAMDEAHIAGAAVSVVQDGAVVLAKGYGFADFDPPRPVDAASTLFRIGSITKTFTWIAVMQAAERGEIDLDEPVNAYLSPDLRIPDESFTEPIRIWHLMSHSAGFEDHALGLLFVNRPERVRTLHDFLRDERPRRVREPGRLSSYSNYGTALVGAILELVTGLTWQDLVERDILEPLGVSHISAREPYPPRADLPTPMPEALATDLSAGFRWTGLGHRERDFEHITQIGPAGAMSASAFDMGRYMLLLLNEGALDGARIYGSRAAAAFRDPMIELPPAVGTVNAGFFEFPLPGGFRGFGHDGGTLSFFTNMTVVPELRLGIFVATNTEGGARLSEPLPSRVVEHFYGPGRRVPDESPLDARQAAEYAGHYLATRRAYHGLEGFLMRLQGTLPVAATPDGFVVLTVGGERRKLVPADAPDVFRPAAGSDDGPGGVLFRREGGRVAAVVLPSMAFERVGPLDQGPTLLVAAALALLAAAGTVAGRASAFGRVLPATGVQRVAGRVQLAAALFWLAAAVALALVLARAAADIAAFFYDWPVRSMVAGSWAMLAASMLSLAALLLVPAVWLVRRPAGAGRAPGWSRWRRVRYTLAALAFAACGALLARWGALTPWDP
ncbi:MAG TPA: serine hydrolase domain-containing protein [Gammaproteobacteria bacterium]